MDKTKLTAYINGKVTYDDYGQYLWINSPDGQLMIGEIRGWGHIQNMKEFKGDLELAGKFQDQVGQFVADAINEKIAAQNQLEAYKEELRKEIEGELTLLKKYPNRDKFVAGNVNAWNKFKSLLDKPQNNG